MKYFDVNKLCELLRINPVAKSPITIKNVRASVREINHDTVIFHLNKTQTLDINKLQKLRNCFIITEQPLLKKYKKLMNISC